jgi:NAD-dependent DNA ligase
MAGVYAGAAANHTGISRYAGRGCGISSTLRANGLFCAGSRQWESHTEGGVCRLKEDDWRRMQERNEEQWRRLPGIGAERARQLVTFLHHPDVAALAKWLSEQHVPGF